MNIRETSVEQESPDPFTQLNQVADGYIVVGYLKDTHDKFAQFYATDRACNDALAFFHAPVNEWMQFMESDQCKQEKTWMCSFLKTSDLLSIHQILFCKWEN